MKRPFSLFVGCLIGAAMLILQPAHTALAQTGPPPVDDPGAAILVPAGAVWRYLDDGLPGGDAWRLPGFPDANWKSGPAQLGYGDGDEATVVSYGPNPTAKYITTWFRHAFDVADASHLMHLVLYLVRDDGAVVYLNGQELVRDNMPAGPVSSRTLASSVVGANENQFHRYDLAASFLVTGRNVLAVEVHQANPASSDISFDAQLVALTRPAEPLPVVSVHASVPETIEPSPTTRVRPGEFTITRTGSTNEPLILFLEYGGTATPGHDYAEQPRFLLMPAGESAVAVLVEPKDDALVEGDETVTARLAIPPIDALPNYHIDPAHSEACVIIHDDDFPTLPTLVSIAADDPVATEMDLTPAIDPARFTITRTGDLSRDLLVFYSVHGSATPGLDYRQLPGTLDIPAGQSSATFDILGTGDMLTEGMETIYLRLEPSPLMGPLPTYEISASHDAVAIILDNPVEPKPAVEIVWPEEGAQFTLPTNVEIVAAAYHPTLDMSRVDFYAGDTKIGDSLIVFDRLFSGGLIVHRLNWTNPPAGTYTLTARAFAEGSGVSVSATSPPVHITVKGGPVLPVVAIEATGRIAEETSDPLDRLRLVGEFTISRTGPTDPPLSVFVHYSGMATPGVDYPALPWLVTIPQGAASTTIRVEPIPDGLREGIETLVATVSDCPPDTDPPLGMPCVGGFETDPAHGQATVFIRDDGITQASLAILRPHEGAVFKAGDTILIEAVAIALDGYLPRVEFWDGDHRIGVSEIVFIRAPDPGTPIFHTFEWRSAPAGSHVLTARVPLFGAVLASVPVHIRVEAEPSPAVVRIEATQPIAEESSEPLRRIPFVGEFTVSRTGPTELPLSVFVHYSGLATPGVDYPLLPWRVTIPAGAVSTTIRVVPIPDRVPEGIETLVAALSHCPPETDPPLGMPCVGGFEIDPAHGPATVFIRDDGITEASLVIRQPIDGAVFRAGQTIPIEAITVDLDSYLGRVEFWDGDQLIGVSAPQFFRAPDPGEPIQHMFEWRDAPPGARALTARARRDDGTPVVSAPVHITVGPVVSQPPRIAITHPTAGAQFPLGAPIEIVAETVDPDGYVSLAEFFADGRKLGERRIVFIRASDPGQTQTFTLVWRWPMPGPHVLTARATDDHGDTAWSAPVEIKVAPLDLLPIVRVTARDPWAVEPQSNTVLNTATFRIRRFGPTNAPLAVAYSLHGTAANGVDYERLSGSAIIPAGRYSVDVVLRPLADDLAEGLETAVLRLEDSISAEPPVYRVGFPRRAVALISDHPQTHALAQTRCLGLPGSLLSVGFDAETGNAFRVEGSTDLRNWETVSEALAVDGAVYFVDDEVGSFECRFYRLVPDPFLKVDE